MEGEGQQEVLKMNAERERDQAATSALVNLQY